MTLSPAATARLLDVARGAICAKLAGRPSNLPQWDPAASDLSAELTQPAGCFVSLHEFRTRRLRGCVGRLDATQPVVIAVHQAAESALDDPRFVAAEAICTEQLTGLELEISILSPLQPAATPLAFEPLKHGIYLTLNGRTGCFLPQVARETGWTREHLLDRLCQEKLGLHTGAWQRDDAKLYIFSVLVLGPEPFVGRSLHVNP